jgi:hypothetical protein
MGKMVKMMIIIMAIPPPRIFAYTFRAMLTAGSLEKKSLSYSWVLDREPAMALDLRPSPMVTDG